MTGREPRTIQHNDRRRTLASFSYPGYNYSVENEEKIDLITRNLDEVLTAEELKHLIETKTPLKHYIGFEISGQVHLGTGLMSMMKIKDFLDAGVDCTVFLADWHSWINDKLGGNMDIIQRVAVGYFKEAMKASMLAVGGNPNNIHFLTGSDLYSGHLDYWATVIEISKNTTLSRMLRSISIMGRKEGEAMDFAKLIYPPMQAADIFFQGVNLAQGGMDQRKAHVIARDCALQMKNHALQDAEGNPIKPVAVHHPLLLGLAQPPKWPIAQDELKDLLSELKMSKSKPLSAVFITDSPKEIKQKINKAFCPEKEIGYNPVLNWTKLLVFPLRGALEVNRPEKFGGNMSYSSYQDLERDFTEGALHPMDLKNAVAESIIQILSPVGDYFEESPAKDSLEELKKILET